LHLDEIPAAAQRHDRMRADRGIAGARDGERPRLEIRDSARDRAIDDVLVRRRILLDENRVCAAAGVGLPPDPLDLDHRPEGDVR
jgi:hypothetical protein